MTSHKKYCNWCPYFFITQYNYFTCVKLEEIESQPIQWLIDIKGFGEDPNEVFYQQPRNCPYIFKKQLLIEKITTL